MTDDVVIRPAETDADLAAWTRVRRILLPDEPISTLEQLREAEGPDRLLLLAEVDGTLAGHGFAGRSSFADGFAEPRVLPEHRRHGIGSAVLEALFAFHRSLGHVSVASHVEDEPSLGFATAHGFVEIDRQVEHHGIPEYFQAVPRPAAAGACSRYEWARPQPGAPWYRSGANGFHPTRRETGQQGTRIVVRC